jgi:catechol 2,3-dioxygenase-like lactoylglutathione lyase family enzyme
MVPDSDSMTEPKAKVLDVSAVTLATGDMSRSVQFYCALGFRLSFGGQDAKFTSFAMGSTHLNLVPRSGTSVSPWGRLIFHVSDVDDMYEVVRGAGVEPVAPPRDASWGERYFHVIDPDGHELSFARPLHRRPEAEA